ncbi:hypothetical protein AMK59_1965, partial [Oryctes borbonicus]
NRPISIISYDPPEYQETLYEKQVIERQQYKRYSTLINGNFEECSIPVPLLEDPTKPNNKFLKNTSSGLGTTLDSKDENSTESVELKHFNRGTSGDTENEEESTLSPRSKNKNAEQGKKEGDDENKDKKDQTDDDDDQRPWHALVSYVDEITLGGRRNSKGIYVDGMGSFP